MICLFGNCLHNDAQRHFSHNDKKNNISLLCYEKNKTLNYETDIYLNIALFLWEVTVILFTIVTPMCTCVCRPIQTKWNICWVCIISENVVFIIFWWKYYSLSYQKNHHKLSTISYMKTFQLYQYLSIYFNHIEYISTHV